MAEEPTQPSDWAGGQTPPVPPAPIPRPPEAPIFEPPAHPAPPLARPDASPYEPAVLPPPPPRQQPPSPPGAPPSPAWVPPPPPSKKSQRRTWTIVAVILGSLVLVVGGCTIWFINTVTAPVDKANIFLAQIDRGEYAQAVERTDPGCNFGLTEQDLVDLFDGQDITYNLNSSSVVNFGATVSGSLRIGSAEQPGITLELRKRGDQWRVCGFRLGR